MIFGQEFLVVLSGAMPISEVRGAIPLGIFLFNMAPLKVYLLAVIGNLLPIIPLLFFLSYFSEFLMRKSYFLNRFLSWLFEYTRNRHSDHFHHWRWAPIALFVFVAVPFPLTGVWSGGVASFIFGVPWRKAAIVMSFGVFTAASLVLGASLFGLTVFNKI